MPDLQCADLVFSTVVKPERLCSTAKVGKCLV